MSHEPGSREASRLVDLQARRLRVVAGRFTASTKSRHVVEVRTITLRMDKYFVVVSGLPGSGKSTLARQLAPALALPLLDKDNILERLFELKGTGDGMWRRALSRESDLLLQTEARASDGAVLVSHWCLPGMPLNSGTPTDWISELSNNVVNVHCVCEAEVAAERYARRKRHPGHLDSEKSHA